MAEATDDLLLVQVAGSSFHSSDHLHVFIVVKGFISCDSHSRCWAFFKLVQFEGLERT